MKKAIIGTLVASAAVIGVGAAASADYVSDNAVPGHQKTERQGKVVTKYTTDNGTDCDYIVQTVGDFGGDPYLDDGKMLNVVRCPDGSVVTYHIFHESHPGYSDSLTPIWGSWGYFTTANGAGQGNGR